MSYILDALKRAESERERGTVPGLHSQSVPLRRPVAGTRALAKPLGLVAVALGLVLVGVLAWRSLGPMAFDSNPGLTIRSPIASPGMSAVIAALPTASSTMTLPQLAPPVTAASTGQAPALVASLKPEPPPEPKRQTTTTAVVDTTAPASPRIMPINELPADIRQTLPKVIISGSTYSDNQALRMLIINGEVFREGEKAGPDLQLEQIRVKSAVLNFKGLRYSIAY